MCSFGHTHEPMEVGHLPYIWLWPNIQMLKIESPINDFQSLPLNRLLAKCTELESGYIALPFRTAQNQEAPENRTEINYLFFNFQKRENTEYVLTTTN